MNANDKSRKEERKVFWIRAVLKDGRSIPLRSFRSEALASYFATGLKKGNFYPGIEYRLEVVYGTYQQAKQGTRF